MPDKKEDKEKWQIAQVTTQTEPMIFDAENQKAYTIQEALVIMLNEISEIKAYLTK